MKKIGANIFVILIVLVCAILISATPVWFWLLVIILGFRKDIFNFIKKFLK